MSEQEVDDYLAGLAEPQRGTLEALRRSILAVVPAAEQCISYGMPAFRVEGKVVAGFAAFSKHLSYLPHSGDVLADLGDAVVGYDSTPGSLHFPADHPLPDELVRALVSRRSCAASACCERSGGRRRDEDEVEGDPRPGAGQLAAVGWRRGRQLVDDVDDERVPDAEDSVGVEVGVTAREDVGDEPTVAVGDDHQVEVGGAHRGATRGAQELADGTVVGDRVRRGGDRPEAVAAVGTGAEMAAPSDPVVAVLHVVQAVGVGLPDLDQGAGDG